MFNIWRKIPVVRLLLPLSAGILLEIYTPVAISVWMIGSGFFFFLLSALTWWKTLRQNARLLFNLVLHLQLFCFGGLLTHLNTAAFNPDHFGKFEQLEIVDGVLSTSPEEAKNTFKTTVRVQQVMAGGALHQASGEFLLYISKEAQIEWQKGDRILVGRVPVPVRGPANPGEFDYRKYLYQHGITHQLYLRDLSEARLLSKHYQPGFFENFDKSRNWLIGKLRAAVEDDDAFAVSSALILGQKEFLSPQIRASYAGTGAMHVLAVSGLHVGIIYLILMFSLKWLGENKWPMILKLLLILAGLWSYAVLTGLSPSVLRAATMFSAVAIAQHIGRRSNIYNTLAAAALVMLCYNPYLLFEVGFQLSFLAVLGIVLIQPLIYHQLVVNTWLADKLWQLTSVSLAAQIATFPLGILYFNQFPNYFLLSNFIVIPAAFVILTLGIVLMAGSFIQPLYEFFGFLLNEIVSLLNLSVRFIESLPYATTSGLFLNLTEAIFLYLFLSFLLLMIYQKHVHYLLAALSCCVVILSSYTFRVYDRQNSPVVAVNSISGMTGLTLIDGRQNILVGDSALINNNDKQMYHLSSFWYSRGHKNAVYIDIHQDTLVKLPGFIKRGPFISFHGYHIKLVADDFFPQRKDSPPVDLVVLTGKSKLYEPQPIGQVALSSSYQYRHLCCDTTIAHYTDVRSTGALIIHCNEKTNKADPDFLARK